MQQAMSERFKLYPSCLLWTDSLSPAGRALTARCRAMQTSDPDLLQQMATDARQLLAHGDATGCATVLICLADRCRDAGELVLARECCEDAASHFSSYEDSRHMHNQAVAFYALGLVCQSQGLHAEAVTSYDKAVGAFEQARNEWRWVPDSAQTRIRECDEIVCWIGELRLNPGPGQPSSQPHARARVMIPMGSISAGRPLSTGPEPVASVAVEADAARMADYALQVNGDSMIDAGIKDGDTVLIQRTSAWPTNGQIVAVRIDGMESESVLKRFYRYPNHICLQPANDRYPFLMVLAAWSLKGGIEREYRQKYPTRQLEFYLASSVHCVGWHCGKVP